MSSNSLYRAAAAGLIVSAVLTVPGFVMHPTVDPDYMAGTAWQVSHLILWVGGVAGVFGLVGLYLHYRTEAGLLGTVGVTLASFGLLALIGAYYTEAVIVPGLAAEARVLMETFPRGAPWTTYRMAVAGSGVATGLGVVLLGVGLFRTRLPRWAITAAGIGALAAGIQFALPRPFSLGAVFVLAFGLVGLGYGLWSSAPTAEPGRAIPPRQVQIERSGSDQRS